MQRAEDYEFYSVCKGDTVVAGKSKETVVELNAESTNVDIVSVFVQTLAKSRYPKKVY